MRKNRFSLSTHPNMRLMKISRTLSSLAILGFALLQVSAFAGSMNCLGGQVSLEGGIGSLAQCTQNDNPALLPINNSSTSGAQYIYVLTNNTASIITHFGVSDGIDLDAYAAGVYRIYGFSYTGVLNQATIQSGMPFMGISSNDCFSYSTNYITVTRSTCEAINCQGGNIYTNQGETYISVCADGLPDIYTFTTTGAGNANYTFVLTDADGLIVEITNDNTFDFEGLALGHYSIKGLSYHGQFDAETIQPGQPANEIETDGFCVDFSVYNIGVDVTDCVLGEGCTHLFFSEYIEGSNNNRALEIYNPTPFPVNLNDYDIFVYSNGATAELPIMALSGILQPGDVYVVSNSQAAAEILMEADVTGGVATFTGNDAIALLYNLQPIDVIGVVGEDPGLNGWMWQSGSDTYSTTNRTFVRKPNVNAPTTNWILSRGQWSVFPENTFGNIGSHSSESCVGSTYLGFENTAVLVPEDIGTFDVLVNGYNIIEPIEAIVSVIAGNAQSDMDYVDIFPVTLYFSSEQTTQVISIEIIDDDEMENYEYFTLQITEPTGTVNFVNQTITINIEHSDQIYPNRTIASVTTVDGFGVADSAEVICTLGGVVHGLNLNAAGTEFTLIENHAGIKVFDPQDNHGYNVTEGDSIIVKGRVVQFYGMTFFYADEIEFINAGNALNQPMVVTEITEDHESAMIKIECVSLVNPSQWTNLTSGFDVDITDGINTYTMHIDLDMNLYGINPLEGHFNVVGIGSQHDETSPYLNGYSIWPRYIEDINGRVIASFADMDEMIFGEGGATISFENTSVGATSYLWNLGMNQPTSTEENPTHYYPFSFFIGIADATIALTVTNNEGCSDTYSRTLDVVYSSVEELEATGIYVYPNPMDDQLIIESKNMISSIRVFDNRGKIILSKHVNNVQREELNVSPWSAGIYLLELTTKSGIYSKKLIKP